ncbi:MAG: CAP domain-containing protein [Actinomycetota bacterium]|nr:CAP domain-containing protein [Actinomycetota bacterium]
MKLRRTSVVLFSSVAVAAAWMTSMGSHAGAQTTTACPVSSTDQAIDSEEQVLLNLINQYRQQYGKNALAMHPTVTRAAAWFSRDMATKNYFPYNHVDSNGRTIDQRLSWCGASFTNWAENIYAGRPDAQSVFAAWRNSTGHNANMLRDGVTAAGIARAYGASTTYGWYWTLDLTNSSAVTATTSTTAAPTTTTTAPPSTTTTTAPATTTTTRPTTTTTARPWWCAYYPQYC